MLSHKQALDKFRLAKYDELLARAEAAEKQLAEARWAYGMLGDTYKGVQEKYDDLCCECDKLRQRIAELEKLVPDADVLDEVVEEAICWELGLPYGSDGVAYAGEMRRTAAAIRKYRETTDGP